MESCRRSGSAGPAHVPMREPAQARAARGADQGAHPRKGTLARVNPRLLLALFLTGLFAIGAAAYAIVESGDEPPDEAYEGFAGSRLPDGVRAPAFELTDEQEERIAMSDFRGEPVIVTFLYTHCDDTCPPAAQQVKGALERARPGHTGTRDRGRAAARHAGQRARVPLRAADARPDAVRAWRAQRARSHLARVCDPAAVALRGAPGADRARGRPRLPARRLPDRPGDARADRPRHPHARGVLRG